MIECKGLMDMFVETEEIKTEWRKEWALPEVGNKH